MSKTKQIVNYQKNRSLDTLLMCDKEVIEV